METYVGTDGRTYDWTKSGKPHEGRLLLGLAKMFVPIGELGSIANTQSMI